MFVGEPGPQSSMQITNYVIQTDWDPRHGMSLLYYAGQMLVTT